MMYTVAKKPLSYLFEYKKKFTESHCFSQKRFSLHENIILINVIRKYGGYQKMWLTLCTLNQLRMNSLKRLLQSLKDSNLALFRVY